ncbi:ABC transporter ATP-binding protein/permease [Methylomagnum sp.]
MNQEEISIDRQTWHRFIQIAKSLLASNVGRKAVFLFVGLFALLIGTNALNVVNSYVGRDFMTAAENRDANRFIWLAVIYLGVFAASTGVAVYYRFLEESLGLVWREWLTRRLVDLYLDHPIYYRLSDRNESNGEILNPDQRIAEDVKAFTVTILSFVLLLLNGVITIVAFSGVILSISPLLFGVVLAYAGLGTYAAFVLGRPLVGLNYAQLDKEATFRADLVHAREHAEPIAVLRREGRTKSRALRHLDEVVANFRKIVTVNRNLGCFTTGYNYLTQIIPALVVAPLFVRGEVEFGVVTQSAMAFTHLLGAFSLVVNQFQSISSFGAVIARLGMLIEGMEQAQTAPMCAIESRGEESRLGYENLTLSVPNNGQVLVENLTVSIPQGRRVLVVGPNETANTALFRATAGLWETGGGCVIHPGPDAVMFLPERPYLPPGTLRELLLRTGQKGMAQDDRVAGILAELRLTPVIARVGGLDVEQNWDSQLSLGEQRLMAFARLLIAAPRFAVLDRLGSALDADQLGRLLDRLNERSITYVHFGEPDEPLDYYDAVLELAGDGPWAWRLLDAAAGKAASGA